MFPTPERSEIHSDNATPDEVVDPSLGEESLPVSPRSSRFPLGSRRLLRALPIVALVACFAAPPVVGAIMSRQEGSEPSQTPPEPSEIIYHRPYSYDRTRSGTPGSLPPSPMPRLGDEERGSLGGSPGGKKSQSSESLFSKP
jgi:hypothetical protein